MRSEKIARKIITKIREEVKDFMSETIANHRTIEFGEIEDRIQELSQRFSRRLAEGALEAIGNGYVGRTIQCECGGFMEYRGDNRWKLTSLSGELEIYRAYYYCKGCGSSKVPLDEQLSLEGKHQSIGVRRQIALMGMSEPFMEATKRLKSLTGVSVSAKEEQLESEEMGKEVGMGEDRLVEAFWSEEKDIEPEVTARRLYITADGTIVSTDEGGKEAKIGGVYETPLAKDALASHIRYTGGFHNSEYFGKKLYILALKGGLKTALEIVFIGDGSKWIWSLARYHFPEAIQIVDWYHVEERIWDVGRTVFGEGTKATDKWVQQQLWRLMKGDVEEIVISLSELSASNPDIAEKVDDNITYFTNNKDRMRYNEYKEKGYHIGSGTVESACKHVVGQRLKQAGMRWSVEGADAILQLRILWKNGEWNRFWESRKVELAA
jgi:hypothetical protein